MAHKLSIGYDPSIFCSQRYGGISRYYCELASRISINYDVNVTIAAPMHINAYLQYMPKGLVTGFKQPSFKLPGRALRAMAMLIGGGILSTIEPDIVHETYYHPSKLGPRKAKRVLTIYDMIHEKFALDFHPKDQTSTHKAVAAKRADHIICISESTRRDAVEILGLPVEKTSVIYLGSDLMDIRNIVDEKQYSPLYQPFLLFVGNRGGHKNFLRLLEAFGISPQLRTRFKLICFGGGPFSSHEMLEIKSHSLGDNQVIQLDGTDKLLATLYKSATVFIYPSLYEGFGIPPLEAMSYDCPVVCSNTSSIPEVVGDAGQYFDPYDTESMRLAIEDVTESNDLQGYLAAKGRKRLEFFSWDQCAAETLETYKKLV